MKRLLIVDAILIAALILAVSMGAAAKTEVEVLVRPGGDGLNNWYTEQAKLFNAQSDEYVVNVEFGPSYPEFVEKITAMSATDTLPDIAGGVNIEWASHLITGGFTADIARLIERDPDISLDEFFPAAIEYGTVNGQLGLLPFNIDTGFMIYNLDQFNEAGIASPKKQSDSGTWTWSSFLDAAKRLTIDRNGDGNPDRFGYAQGGWPWGLVFGWVHNGGGSFTNPEVTRATVDRPEAYESIQFYADLNNVHHVVGGDVVNGTAAMRVGPLGVLRQAVDAGVNARPAPLPSKSAGQDPVHVITASGNMLFKGGNETGGWAFLKFLNSKASYEDLIRRELRFPPRPDAAQLWTSIFNKMAGDGEVFLDIFAHSSKFAWGNPRWAENQLNGVLFGAKNLGPVFNGEMPARQWAAQKADVINGRLAQ